MNRLLIRLVVAYLIFILINRLWPYHTKAYMVFIYKFKIAGFATGTEQSFPLFRNILRTTVFLAYQTTVGERGNGAGEWD